MRNVVRALLQATPLKLFPGHDLRSVPHDRADIVFHHPEDLGASSWPVEPS